MLAWICHLLLTIQHYPKILGNMFQVMELGGVGKLNLLNIIKRQQILYLSLCFVLFVQLSYGQSDIILGKDLYVHQIQNPIIEGRDIGMTIMREGKKKKQTPQDRYQEQQWSLAKEDRLPNIHISQTRIPKPLPTVWPKEEDFVQKVVPPIPQVTQQTQKEEDIISAQGIKILSQHYVPQKVQPSFPQMEKPLWDNEFKNFDVQIEKPQENPLEKPQEKPQDKDKLYKRKEKKKKKSLS